MDDDRIVELFFERSENAITELANKYEKSCMNISLSVVNDVQDAEECVNDSYLAIWDTIPPAKPNPLKAYLFRIVRNISINKYKRNTRKKRNGTYDLCLEELEYCVGALKNEANETDYSEVTDAINDFLEKLDEINQMLFVRRYWYMDSYESLAEKTGLKEGTIRTRISRVKMQLKSFLLERGAFY